MARVSKDARKAYRSTARTAPDVGPTLERLGATVRRLRSERKLTQEQLASLASLDAKHVQDIEAGRANVTVSTLLGVARALDLPLASLFTDA